MHSKTQYARNESRSETVDPKTSDLIVENRKSSREGTSPNENSVDSETLQSEITPVNSINEKEMFVPCSVARNDERPDKISDETSENSSQVASVDDKSVTSTNNKIEVRNSQKTRSFSTVEETSNKKITIDQLGTIEDFPLKDVAHSRSEQLETQSLLQHETISEMNSSLIASSNTVVDPTENYCSLGVTTDVETERRVKSSRSRPRLANNSIFLSIKLSLYHVPSTH